MIMFGNDTMRALRLAAATTCVFAALAATTPAAQAQQKFTSAEAAADALAAAARAGDRKQVIAVLGPGSTDIASSGDAVDDEETRKAFVAAYDAKHAIKLDGGKATLLLGQDDFPFPVPLVEKNGSWSFDVKAGREEILARRIGRNELSAIQVALAYYDAQNEYADVMPKVDGMSVYAQRVVSSPGKKDGLYWPAAAGEPESPLGEAVAEASQRGYKVGSGAPYHGYRFKILTRQGPAAPGGALNYIANGNMIGGFALVAWPAQYGNTGIATFMINHRGDVYEKDLGDDTEKLASRITSFNPDHTWKKVIETQEQK